MLISPKLYEQLFTFYEQICHIQIPKEQKDNFDLTVFLRFWDLCAQKLLVNVGEMN